MISRERCFTIPIGSFHRDHSDFPTGESCHRASFAWWPTVRLCLESISRRVRHLRRVDAYNVTIIADDWRTTLTDTVHYRIIVDSIEQGFSFRTPFRTPEFLPARETGAFSSSWTSTKRVAVYINRCNDQHGEIEPFYLPFPPISIVSIINRDRDKRSSISRIFHFDPTLRLNQFENKKSSEETFDGFFLQRSSLATSS